MLPVALAVSALTGGHRPRLGDYLGCIGVLGGLAMFLILVGRPGEPQVPRPGVIVFAVGLVLVGGLLACAVVIKRGRVVRGAVYGGVAGAYFGALAVMVDAASDRVSQHGFESLIDDPRGFVPIICLVVLGVTGIVLTQMSFQVGALGATLPANLALDPLMGVALGAMLLHEYIPLSAGHLAAYAVCLGAVVAGAVRLADPHAGPIEPDDEPAPSG
jgi:hypothetical protein